ncbi:hypothetical protein E4V51_33970, partial [Paenibacillus sp. 28ISP30-2]|nr:hypothetical protein [Paenibacillus sp. 28ISP30-2]
SINIPALRLFLYEVKIPNAWNFVRSLGITTIQPQDEHAQTGVLGGLSKGFPVHHPIGCSHFCTHVPFRILVSRFFTANNHSRLSFSSYSFLSVSLHLLLFI